jgi:hypothetical protein
MAVPKTAALPLGDSPIAVPEKQAFQKGPGNYTKVYLFFEVQLLFIHACPCLLRTHDQPRIVSQ